MFEVNNNIAKIDGKNSKFNDNSLTNPSEAYGRNAVNNFYEYAESPITKNTFNTAPILDFGINENTTDKNIKALDKFIAENDEYLKALPPLEFEYRYMPTKAKGQIDKKALLGAAYEDMQHKKEMSIEEMDYNFAPNKNFTSKALDINKDGKISNSEYSAGILAADMLSKSDVPDTNNIDGTINSKGMNAVLNYANISNISAAEALYSKINNTYKL